MRLANLRTDGNRALVRLIAGRTVLPILTCIWQLVHDARSRQRRNRQPVMGRRATNSFCPFALGGTTGGVPAGEVLLIGRDRLSATNQVNE
jgi:hypothetical protein